jgi:homocysteine S-methyltransferase
MCIDINGKLIAGNSQSFKVGILPLSSLRHAAFLDNEVPGITIPLVYQSRLEEAGDKAAWEGVKIALEPIKQIKPWANGINLTPQFNRFDLAAEIIEKCKVA